MLFYDGSNTSTCLNGNDLAWTSPGNQVVYVCNNNGRFVSNSNSTYIGNTMIHEELHSLGLGENPPSSADIQNQVAARCGS
jgi:hypothetical protein